MARSRARSALRDLAFTSGERTFTCTVAPRRAADPVLWWWFSVAGGTNHRYAPFVALPEDTAASVQERIVAYYDDHLARRAAPPVSRYRRANG